MVVNSEHSIDLTQSLSLSLHSFYFSFVPNVVLLSFNSNLLLFIVLFVSMRYEMKCAHINLILSFYSCTLHMQQVIYASYKKNSSAALFMLLLSYKNTLTHIHKHSERRCFDVLCHADAVCVLCEPGKIMNYGLASYFKTIWKHRYIPCNETSNIHHKPLNWKSRILLVSSNRLFEQIVQLSQILLDNTKYFL